MVSQAKGGCNFQLPDDTRCGSMQHTSSYHKERKPLKRTAIKDTTASDLLRVSGEINRRFGLPDMTKKPRKKSTPRALAKTKAWDAFSIYIRTRDCIRFTGNPLEGMCVTCKGWFPRIKLQAGHFVGGRGNAVLFNEQIVYSQCAHCNQKPPMGIGGNYAAYTLFMFDEGYTRNEIEAFLALKGTTRQYKVNDFIEIKQRYDEKLKDLLLTIS